YAELFRSESQDQLATITRALLALEGERAAPGAVAEVFRAVHTVKGMAATMGYQAVADFAHEFETLLDRMRRAGEGDARVSQDVMDALFASADALEAGIAEASESAPRTPAMANALARLGAALDGAFDAPTPATAPGQALSGPAGMPRGSDAPSVQVVEAKPEPTAPAHDPFDGPGVIVRVRPSPTTALPGVRALIVTRRLAALGEVAAVSPPLDVLQAATEPKGYAVRLVTAATQAEIEAAVRAAGDIESVQVDMAGRARKRAPSPHDEPIVETSSARMRQVKIDLARLDTMMNLVGELVIARGRLLQLAAGADGPLEEAVQQTAYLVGELQREVTASRMVPVGQVCDRLPRLVRDAARSLKKEIRFEIEGRDIELDRSLLDEMAEPIVHL